MDRTLPTVTFWNPFLKGAPGWQRKTQLSFEFVCVLLNAHLKWGENDSFDANNKVDNNGNFCDHYR